MEIQGFDHVVLCTGSVSALLRFYRDVLGLEAREERPGKWSLHSGSHKISLQDAATRPAIAAGTAPGSGSFCFLTETPLAEIVARPKACGVAVVDGPGERIGATAPLMSVYINDPDGNLVGISNQLT